MLVYCLQGKGHSEGSYDQNMTVSVVSPDCFFVSFELPILLQSTLVQWYIIISQSVL